MDKVTLISRPRRFSKTTIVSMVDAWFNCTDPHELFKGLEVWEQINSDLLAARQDVRSIFVTFKDVRGESYDSLYTTIRSAFINVVFDYEQLYGQFKQTYGDFIVHVDSPGQAQLQKLLTGFVDFIRFLAKHLRCKFVILLDEYDKILLDAASSVEAYGRDYFETILGVYRNFYLPYLKIPPLSNAFF